MSDAYREFLVKKTQAGAGSGMRAKWMPSFLFDFQSQLVEWAIDKGRAAIFADCGLGKTIMQLVWAENIVRQANGRVLILTPLAVAAQTVREAEKFGIACERRLTSKTGIVVTNYERLHYYDPADFVGVVCDESSILKSFDGVRRGEITAFMRRVPYRLLCTATAAPNDYVELGTSSEALGYLGHMDMLGRFFVADDGKGSAARRGWGQAVKFRLKGHAKEPFWRWVCSWARAVRKPSDLGCDDGLFTLPELVERELLVEVPAFANGMLFDLPAEGLAEQRRERSLTIRQRCKAVAEIITDLDRPAIAWCDLNAEAALIEKMIPGSIQIAGEDAYEAKEEKFASFISGQSRVLVTKPKIGAWGLNFQHCADLTFFPSHSFEQYYQAIRRCWRFGQTRPVNVNMITTPGAAGIMRNLQRKAAAADEMFSQLVTHMREHMVVSSDRSFPFQEKMPPWLYPTN